MAETAKGTMKDLAEYLFGRMKADRPVTVDVAGQPYAVEADGTLGKAVRDLAPQWDSPTLFVSTLSGLVGAVNAGLDGLTLSDAAIRVVDVHTVQVVAKVADKYGRRHVWVQAKHEAETKFQFDFFYDTPEKFILAFRSSFYFNDDAAKVQQLCSTVGAGDAVVVVDDGISQEVTIKAGTVTRSTVQLPADGVPLIPWRTFRDAAPVESRFLLRMKGVKDGLPHIALFEIDAKWRINTMFSIASYLQAQLPTATILA